MEKLTYIGETIRNIEERWSEHVSALIINQNQLAKHLADNKEHSFWWSISLAAPKYGRTRKTWKHSLLSNLNHPQQTGLYVLAV